MDLLSKTSEDLNSILSFVKNYSKHYLNLECCGFIGINSEKQYVAEMVPNRSSDPIDYFLIDPLDYLRFINENEILLIFHSHPNTQSYFSDTDQNNAEAMCIPFLLYSLVDDKFSIYIPQNHQIDVNILNKVQGII